MGYIDEKGFSDFVWAIWGIPMIAFGGTCMLIGIGIGVFCGWYLL